MTTLARTFVWMCLVASMMAGTALAADRPPNFVVIFCDDLAYADIGPFGAKGYATPHLDQMAAEGRGLLKDVSSTLHEVFFGKGTGPHEPGTPLAPTQAMVTHDLTGQQGLSMDDFRALAEQNAKKAFDAMDGQQRGRGM